MWRTVMCLHLESDKLTDIPSFVSVLSGSKGMGLQDVKLTC